MVKRRIFERVVKKVIRRVRETHHVLVMVRFTHPTFGPGAFHALYKLQGHRDCLHYPNVKDKLILKIVTIITDTCFHAVYR